MLNSIPNSVELISEQSVYVRQREKSVCVCVYCTSLWYSVWTAVEMLSVFVVVSCFFVFHVVPVSSVSLVKRSLTDTSITDGIEVAAALTEPDPHSPAESTGELNDEQAQQNEKAATNIPTFESVPESLNFHVGERGQLECVVRDLGTVQSFLTLLSTHNPTPIYLQKLVSSKHRSPPLLSLLYTTLLSSELLSPNSHHAFPASESPD